MARVADRRLMEVKEKIAEFVKDGNQEKFDAEILNLSRDVPSDFRYFVNYPSEITAVRLLSSIGSWKGSVLLEEPTDQLMEKTLECSHPSQIFLLSGSRVKCLMDDSCHKVYDLINKEFELVIEGFNKHNDSNKVFLNNLEKLSRSMKDTLMEVSKDKNAGVNKVLIEIGKVASQKKHNEILDHIGKLRNLIAKVVADRPVLIDEQVERALKIPLENISKLEKDLLTGSQGKEKVVNEELVKEYSALALQCDEAHQKCKEKISETISLLNNMDGKQEQCDHKALFTGYSKLAIEYGKQQEELHQALDKAFTEFSSVVARNEEVLHSFQKDFSDLKSVLKVVGDDTFCKISTLIFRKQYEEAFKVALLRRDAVILSWICSKVKLEELLPTTALSHQTLHGLLVQLSDNLSLDHNLSPDLINDTQTKLKWMILMASWIPEKVMERDRLDLEKVQKKMHKFFMEYGSSPQVSSIISESRSLDRILSYILSNKDGPSCSSGGS